MPPASAAAFRSVFPSQTGTPTDAGPLGKLARILPGGALRSPISVIHDPDDGDVSHLKTLGLRPFRFLCTSHSRETVPGIECGRVEHFRHLTLTAWADSEKTAAAHVRFQLKRFSPSIAWTVLPAA